MLKEERQQEILKIINSEQKVIASDLSHRLSVSEDTIRRDLKDLDTKGLIRRVHSGALRLGPPLEDFSIREKVFSDIKMSLAQKALPFIKDDQVLLIDGGTTNLCLTKQLPINLKATVITNSPPIAVALANHKQIEVIMLGGTLNKKSMINVGIDTVEALSTMRVDIYIMGIYNIDSQIGVSCPTLSECLTKRKMVSISSEIIALVTSDKLGTVSNQVVCPPQDLSYLITDSISSEIKNLYSRQNITVID